jgi:hypothetical protein
MMGGNFFAVSNFPHIYSSIAVEIHAVWGVSMKTRRTGVFPILHFLRCTHFTLDLDLLATCFTVEVSSLYVPYLLDLVHVQCVGYMCKHVDLGYDNASRDEHTGRSYRLFPVGHAMVDPIIQHAWH